MRKTIITIIILSLIIGLRAQNIAITDDAGYTADPSAMLDVKATTKGVLIPRVTSIQRNAISAPVNGLLVFDITEEAFFFFNGTQWISLSNTGDIWTKSGNVIYASDNANKVGVGTSSPIGKLEVKADGTIGVEEPIFEVINANGDTVFAVYPEGVRIYVDDNPAKSTGSKGGFAVGGFSSAKGITNEFLRVTPDSVRVYIDDEFVQAKASGSKGGFAVGGFSSAKVFTDNYLFVQDDSSRVWTNGTGGFEIMDRAAGDANYLNLTPQNYFIGHESGVSNTLGLYNSFLGYQAGKSNISASDNVFIGYQCGMTTDVGGQNVFVGTECGKVNENGNHNVFIGHQSGMDNISGNYNVFMGRSAGAANTTGSFNTYLGDLCGMGNTTGQKNLFAGAWAGKMNNGDYNIFMGHRTGESNTTGNGNTYVGFESGYQDTTGSNNCFFGKDAGYGNLSGSNNCFIGVGAGHWNEHGDYNIFIGNSAGTGNDNGNYNIAIGYNSGTNLTNSEENIFIGRYSGWQTNGATSNDSRRNLFIGSSAGYSNQTGSQNTYLGFNAGYNNASGSGNICIGAYAGYNETTSGKLYIHNNASSSPLIYGDFNTLEVQINGDLCYTGTLGACSDMRYKKNIMPLTNVMASISQINGVSFDWKKDEFPDHVFDDKKQIGVIAQEVEAVFPELVSKDKDGYKTVDYTKLTAVLLQAIKEQQIQINNMQKEIDTLKKE